jgi:hypothetical protein
MNPNEPKQIENDSRHPVDFLEPLPNGNKSPRRTCEVLSRTFVWVADGSTLEQVGLRATVVLYCVRTDLIGGQKASKKSACGQAAPGKLSNILWRTSATPLAGNEHGDWQHRDRKVEA